MNWLNRSTFDFIGFLFSEKNPGEIKNKKEPKETAE